MTRFQLSILAISAALSMTAGLAIAGDTVSADQILNALQPKKPLTRGLSAGRRRPTGRRGQGDRLRQYPAQPQDAVALARRARGNRRTRRDQAEDRSRDPVRLQFGRHQQGLDVGGAGTRQGAFRIPSLKGSTFVVAGHTDAIGSEAYNQELSERRADTIKRFLTEKYGIDGADLVTVGYGESKPKDANAPMDPTNRRVQVVNMDTKTASK